MRQSGRPPQLPSHQPLPAPEAHPEVASSPPWQMSLPIHLRLRAWSPDPWRNDKSPAWAPWVSSTTAVTGTDPEGWASTFIGLPGGGHTVEVVSPTNGKRGMVSPHRGPGAQGEAEPELETLAQTPPPRPLPILFPKSPSPYSPCPPHHSRAVETTTGPVSEGGRGVPVSRGQEVGKDSCTPEPVPSPSSSLCPLPTNSLLHSLPNPTRGFCDRGTGDHRPVQHATCRGQGQPAGKSCLGFYTVSLQALTGVSRDTEHPPLHPDTWLRLLGQEAGLCDPGPVTEPFHPSAEKGSLVPESH